MRIGLLIYGDIESISGGYLYNRHLINFLRSHGDQVEVISIPYRNYWRALGDNFQAALLDKIINAQFDILLQDAMVHPSLFLLNRRLAKQLNIPRVALIHLLTSFERHSLLNAWIYRLIERAYLKSVTGLIVNSQTTLAQCQMLLTPPLASVCLAVPAGDNFEVSVNNTHIEQRALRTGPLSILMVGNIIRRKGLHVLIQALEQLPEADFKLNVAGRLDMEPAYVDEIQKLIRTGYRQAQIKLLGPVQGLALVELYQNHQLMVLPSSYESYGIVYVEAQQFGLPVIGTTEGAAKEIIRDGENGFLVSPEDPQMLATVLQKLQQDREALLQLSRNALAAYQRHPVWADTCASIREYLYRQIQNQPAKPTT